MSPLDPLRPVGVDAIEVVTVPMALATPLRTAAGVQEHRDVLLVHVRAGDVDGWAEVAVQAAPSYEADFTGSARLALAEHLVPAALAGPTGDGLALGPHLAAIRGHHAARAALQLAVLDAQLRAAGRSLASWLGTGATDLVPGAALGLHDDPTDLLAEADAALAAGAGRLRAKVAPGRAGPALVALRAHVGDDIPLQADANGSFRLDDDAHAAELRAVDGLGLACLEQPLAPEDLVGHAELARRMATPIALDEPLTSVGALEAAHALGACEVACLKPGRVGGWPEARRFVARCCELDVPVFVGGMLETGIGRHANAALAAFAATSGGPALAPDLDPRGRFDPDLADPLRPTAGRVAVPDAPGTGASPPIAVLVGGGVDSMIFRA